MNKSKPMPLSVKIARLIEERGWNQDEFARITNLNRLTVHGLFDTKPRRLHNNTVAACAGALGVTVYDLRERPLEELLVRMGSRPVVQRFASRTVAIDKDEESRTRRKYEEATQPELLAWIESNPERAAELSPLEWDELLSLQGTGGPLTSEGVVHFVDLIERRRRLIEKVAAVASTEYVDLLEQFVEVLHEKIQPYRDRKIITK